MTTPPPIFVIGCPRSGTTLLRLFLDSHPHISCGPETHFLSNLESIVERHWRRVEVFGFEKEYWHRKIAEFFDSFQMDYAQRRGKTRWADKTPRYAMKLPFINALFPTCRFVHMIRAPHDVVSSHRDRWGYRSAVTCAAGTWRNYVTAAREFARTVPPERFIELRYEQLVGQPEGTMRELLEFLGEPWVPEVLEYDRFEHAMMGQKHQRLTTQRREAAGQSEVVYRSRVGAGKKGLDPLLKFLIRTRCAAVAHELGY